MRTIENLPMPLLMMMILLIYQVYPENLQRKEALVEAQKMKTRKTVVVAAAVGRKDPILILSE